MLSFQSGWFVGQHLPVVGRGLQTLAIVGKLCRFLRNLKIEKDNIGYTFVVSWFIIIG